MEKISRTILYKISRSLKGVNNMRILMLTKWLVKWNGASRSVYELSNKIKQDHEVKIVAHENYIDSEWEKEFDIYKLKSKEPFALLEIRNIIKNYKPDVIYSQNHLGLSALFTGIPLVVVNRSNWPMNWFLSLKNFLAGILIEIPQEIESHFATKIVSVSKYTQSNLKKRRINSIVIYNGVDKQYLDFPTNQIDLKHPAALFVGSVDNRKAKHLVQVVKLLSQKKENVHTYIIGPAINKKIVNDLEKINNTHYLGAINDVRPYYYEADTLIFTSEIEACPRVLIEAQACGLPAVSFDVCSHSEIIENGKTGFVVPKDDVTSMVDKIIYILGDVDLKNTMSENATQNVKNNFFLDDKAKEYIELFKHVSGQE
jgi:glycosyltransferase involved in cell wall biosynthesis